MSLKRTKELLDTLRISKESEIIKLKLEINNLELDIKEVTNCINDLTRFSLEKPLTELPNDLLNLMNKHQRIGTTASGGYTIIRITNG